MGGWRNKEQTKKKNPRKKGVRRGASGSMHQKVRSGEEAGPLWSPTKTLSPSHPSQSPLPSALKQSGG